jgi:hypothetical protein
MQQSPSARFSRKYTPVETTCGDQDPFSELTCELAKDHEAGKGRISHRNGSKMWFHISPKDGYFTYESDGRDEGGVES